MYIQLSIQPIQNIGQGYIPLYRHLTKHIGQKDISQQLFT